MVRARVALQVLGRRCAVPHVASTAVPPCDTSRLDGYAVCAPSEPG
ncbi:hypothetical protein EON68_02915, partial [archaeon]